MILILFCILKINPSREEAQANGIGGDKGCVLETGCNGAQNDITSHFLYSVSSFWQVYTFS
jgi:hypothetical protein